MELELNFNNIYAEQIMLPSGESIRFRLVRPTDKVHVRRGFAELSPASRRRRFFAGKDLLSEAELRYFTELDQFDHFAIGAMYLNAVGEEGEGAGVARFVRFPSDPKCAEVAIAVIDRLQGKGIGSSLLKRLSTAAIERGVDRFRFECLPYNLEMQRLLRKVYRSTLLFSEDSVLVAEAYLAENLLDVNEGSHGCAH